MVAGEGIFFGLRRPHPRERDKGAFLLRARFAEQGERKSYARNNPEAHLIKNINGRRIPGLRKMQFEELVKKLSPTLKRITYRLKASFSFFNGEDLYQEALLHLWQDYNSGRLSDKTDSYILQGCYFHMRNYIRLQKIRRNTISLDALINPDTSLKVGELLFEPQENGAAEYLRKLDNKLIAETIQNNGLSPKEKRVLCFYAQGLTTRQIGERLGVSHVRVVKMTAVIREKCKKYLDP